MSVAVVDSRATATLPPNSVERSNPRSQVWRQRSRLDKAWSKRRVSSRSIDRIRRTGARRETPVLTQESSYQRYLDGSVRNAWTVDECFDGRDFDFTKAFLPDRMAGVS